MNVVIRRICLLIGYIGLACMVSSCAVKMPVKHKYKLDQFSAKALGQSRRQADSIMVSQPEAVAGYDTEQMLYILQPYELSAFVHNAWVGPPSEMLLPLMLQALQSSDYFYAVASAPYGDKTEFRLDTQLIALHQNFLEKPSRIELTVKVVLTHVDDGKVIGSKIIRCEIPCPQDTPYGGVIAANHAGRAFTNTLVNFVMTHVQRYHVKHPSG